jgi:hypothetical protein
LGVVTALPDFVAMARHSPSAGSNPSCGWSFLNSDSYYQSTVGPMFCNQNFTVVCTLGTSSGLPVELMEFSIEGENGSDGAEEESGSSADSV